MSMTEDEESGDANCTPKASSLFRMTPRRAIMKSSTSTTTSTAEDGAGQTPKPLSRMAPALRVMQLKYQKKPDTPEVPLAHK